MPFVPVPKDLSDEIPSTSARVREGFTSPPQRYSEDTLLRAMETAGAEDMAIHGLKPEDAERKGLGTPATRAGIIERKQVERGQLTVRPRKGIYHSNTGFHITTLSSEERFEHIGCVLFPSGKQCA